MTEYGMRAMVLDEPQTPLSLKCVLVVTLPKQASPTPASTRIPIGKG